MWGKGQNTSWDKTDASSNENHPKNAWLNLWLQQKYCFCHNIPLIKLNNSEEHIGRKATNHVTGSKKQEVQVSMQYLKPDMEWWAVLTSCVFVWQSLSPSNAPQSTTNYTNIKEWRISLWWLVCKIVAYLKANRWWIFNVLKVCPTSNM